MNIYTDYSYTIGHTPLIKLKHFPNIHAKIENRNPSGSVKCRIGVNMILKAEARGDLPSGGGGHIVEASSGNTGIALAFVSAARGHKLTLVMPESFSLERRKLLVAFGAELILSPAEKGIKGAMEIAKGLSESKGYFLVDQFSNPDNPDVHYHTTGKEIWDDTQGEFDILVAGVGTGGTVTGVGRFLKDQCSKAKIIAVEPESSPVITNTLAGKELTHSPHKIQGIGTGFLPVNLDVSFVSGVERISDDVAIKYAHELMQKEGILAGISSGAALAASVKVSENNPGKRIVTILASSAERYLSTALFANVNV